MNRPSIFRPVDKRDLTPVLVPTTKSRSLESLVSNYMMTGDTSGLDTASDDSFDFQDEDHVDFDADIPQSMNKIDAILHYRNIRDSLRSPLQFKSPDSKPATEPAPAPDPAPTSSPEPAPVPEN